MTDEAQVRDAVARTVAFFGGIDIVVNNAAATHIIRSGNAHEVVDESLETFDQFMRVGVYAPFLFAKYAIPEMTQRGGGVIINISSIAAVCAVKGLTVFGPSKAALESLTNQIAVDYRHQGIRAVALRVGPGPMLRETQMLTTRVGVPADVANAVVFAASDEASFITGSVLSVDAGQASKKAMPDLQAVFTKKK
ncbi:SDR family oxidoreductase [Massilia cavernae]|uniref:SDR family oxidoreductase n=1 Tax=Massilia cavernae TaxID=2320864 RepID=A0A418Y0Q0_9BURK|nr:SDR family oxidoreductase [Massilia cavernae]